LSASNNQTTAIMKHRFVSLAMLVAVTGFAPVLRAEPRSNIRIRLTQIDLDVAVRYYEKLQASLRDTKLELLLGEDARESNPADQEKAERKVKRLEELCLETREEILKLGEDLEQAGAAVSGPQPAVSAQGTVQAKPPVAVPGIAAGGEGLAPVAPAADPAAAPPSGVPGAAVPEVELRRR
jgi:hypothetical protein